MIDIAHQVVGVFVDSVVVAVATSITTKFFVITTDDSFVAF